MPQYRFPNLQGVPAENTPEGIVALGGDLSPETLMEGYRHGIFPWPISGADEEDLPMTWFSPAPRAILDFSKLHLPRSLRQAKNRAPFTFTFDRAFKEVISACSRAPRPGQDGTWITEPMLEAYSELHRIGYAHSVEAWHQDSLVGGVYGVDIDGAFSGESMFHTETNASKLALIYLIDHLRSRGLKWMDIQMITPHLEALGATEISRDEYLERLAATRALRLKLFS